ncbi:meiotic recombination protein REC8 homolog [Synchiropus picturatus]
MFYFPTVLQRHGGCFATVWLVATKGIRVPRRQILEVNVAQTCDNIMDYVLERVQPLRPDLPPPRLSLYLSAQLQYGVVVVYHRQCSMFLEDLQTFLHRLYKDKGIQRIDLTDNVPPLLLKDALSFMLETDGAPDPLFGRMHDLMPSPSTVIEMEGSRLREVSPEESALIQASPASAVSQNSDFTAAPEAITLKEFEPAAFPYPEFAGAELPEGGQDMVDFLLEQEDVFSEESATETEQRKERTEEIITANQDPGATLPAVDETTQLPQEELELTAEPPRPLPEHLTQESPSPGAEGREKGILESQEVAPTVVKKKRREPVLSHTETQLSYQTMKQQIQNPLTETRRPLLLPPPSHLRIPAAELFRKPCTFLSEDALSLWRQAATITPVSASDLPVSGRAPESSEKERAKKQEEPQGPEFSSDLSLPHLESSDPHVRMSREMLSEEGASVSSRTGTLLEDIPEMTTEQALHSEKDFWTSLFVHPETSGYPILPEDQATPVTFQSLLPPNTSRRTVASAFRNLLGIVESGTVTVEQTQPYGDIIISPGVSTQSAQV